MPFIRMAVVPGTNFLNLQYGVANTTSLGTRKTNDMIDLHVQIWL